MRSRPPIESGIPLPTPQAWGVFDKTIFADMKVGDSFKLPTFDKGKVILPSGASMKVNTLRGYAYEYGKRFGCNFSVRCTPGGFCRVYRCA